MNTRQKAKHFKRLYEQGLPKKPYPVIYRNDDKEHYRIQHTVDDEAISCLPESMVQKHIEDLMLEELRTLIHNRLHPERDRYTGKSIYLLDVWM